MPCTVVDSTRSACHFMRSVSGAWLLCDRTLAVNYVFLIEQTVLFLVVDAVIFRSNGNGPCEWVSPTWSRQLGMYATPRPRTIIATVRLNYHP